MCGRPSPTTGMAFPQLWMDSGNWWLAVESLGGKDPFIFSTKFLVEKQCMLLVRRSFLLEGNGGKVWLQREEDIVVELSGGQGMENGG